MARSKYSDPMEELRKSLGGSLYRDPMKETREFLAVRDQLDQMKTFQREADVVKGMQHDFDQMKAFQREADVVKGMRHELDQMRVFRESVGKWGEIDVLSGLRESVAALKNVDPMKEFRESLAVRSQFDQMSELRKTMAELTRDPLKDLRALFDATKAAAGLWADDSNADVPPIVSEPESASEMQELGAGIARAVERVKTKSDLAAAVQALIPEIRALKTSRSQRLFALLVLPIIINLIFAILNPISNHYVLRALLDNKRDVQHNAVKDGVSARPNQPARVAVRVVRGGGTRVRVLPKKKARVIAKVEGGELVIFVEKRSRWALIAFTDLASGVPVYGWVYSKYLSVPRIAVASAAEQGVAALVGSASKKNRD